MFDNAVRSVLAVLLQAFNTETTENHGGARSGSDDESPQAVLQQPRMEIEWLLSRTRLMEPEFGPPDSRCLRCGSMIRPAAPVG